MCAAVAGGGRHIAVKNAARRPAKKRTAKLKKNIDKRQKVKRPTVVKKKTKDYVKLKKPWMIHLLYPV